MPVHLYNQNAPVPTSKPVPFAVLIDLLESQGWQRGRRHEQEDGSSMHIFRHRALGAAGYISAEVIGGTVDPEDFKEIASYVIA